MIRDDGTFNLPLSPLSDRILCICSVNHQLQRRRVHAHQSRHCHSQSQCGHAAPWPRRCRASFGTSVIASNTSDLYATFAAFTNGDASVTLLAGPAIELAIEASPVSQTLPPINISDPQDQVLLIASRQAVVEPTDENHDVNATQFPFGIEDLQFGLDLKVQPSPTSRLLGSVRSKAQPSPDSSHSAPLRRTAFSLSSKLSRTEISKSVPYQSRPIRGLSKKSRCWLSALALCGAAPHPSSGLSTETWMRNMVRERKSKSHNSCRVTFYSSQPDRSV